MADEIIEPKLNQEQQEAADGFFAFLLSNEKEMGISGPGGTGKTFLMGHLIDEIMPKYLEMCKLMGIAAHFDEVQMTATTNKATDVLSQATGRPSQTIYSFMNLKVQDDYSTGKSKVTKTLGFKVHERIVIFVDECSLVDTPLNKFIDEGTHDPNVKIVYVGDHCQMAPITETLSPIYRKGIRFFNLTEPMRTSNPVLHAINQQLRNTVETGEFKPIKIVPGVIDHLNDEQMEEMIDLHFKEQTDESKILAYTNARVIQYNDHIRNLRQLPDRYTSGEFLINNNALRLKNSMLPVEAEIEILHLADQSEKIDIEETVKLEIRRAIIKTKLGAIFSDVPLPMDRGHYLALTKHYGSKKDFYRYFDLKNNYPDFRQRDSSTFYKAQGSSYDNVFIDVTNLSTCRNPDQVARQLYVGASRARKRIFFYGELAEKFGGLIC